MLLTWLVFMCWRTALQSRSAAEASLNRKERSYRCAIVLFCVKMNEREEPKKRKAMWTIQARKWYPCLYVPYFSAGKGNIFWWYPIYSDGCSSATMTSMIWWQTATTIVPSVRTPGICIFQTKRVIHKRCNISLWNHQFHERRHKIAINLTSNNSHPSRPPTRKGTLSNSAEITTC